jgi:hypothetical protein
MGTALSESAHKVEFDAHAHVYRFRGVRYPSVTQIIADSCLYGDTSYYTDYSRERGTYVHRVIQWHLSGELDEATIDPVILPYFKGWLRFQKEAAFVSDECEKVLISDSHRFAGTVDHIGHLNGHFCLIDVKTGSPQPAHAIQTAAYGILLKHPGIKRFSLYLTAEGKYKLVEDKDRDDGKIFLSCLAVYYWKQNNLRG